MVAIVVVACAAGIINHWISTKAKRDEIANDVPAAVHQAELDRLEKRIRVLERIVTDRHYDLKKELHELES